VEAVAESVSIETLEQVRVEFSGQILGSGDLGYEEARQVHNGLVDKQPQLIARCQSSADIVDAVNLGRDAGLEISVRGGGHNVAGRAVSDGGLMIDLQPMKGVHVDPKARTVRAQGGLTWREYNRATHTYGLATTGGVISTTGIAGLTLGGGIGWLMAKHGLAIDNLRSVELVTADGQLRTASEDEDPDLFWAVRGGGGNFGVASSFEYDAHPLSTVLGGLIAFPLTDAIRILDSYREVTASLPDELAVFCGLVHAPDGSGTKITAVPVCHCGNPDVAEADLKPFRSVASPLLDMVGPMPYPVVNTLLDDGYPRGARNYWKSAFFKELSDDAIAIMIDAFERAPSAMSGLVIEHFHGQVTRIGNTDTAYPHRQPGYNLVLVSQWMDPSDDETNIAWARNTFDALTPYMAGAAYVNYLGGDEADRVSAAYGPNWSRLVQLKARYDPDNIFHLNQNISPAAG
jgi:FAD/FMN-containing dehydrogenase